MEMLSITLISGTVCLANTEPGRSGIDSRIRCDILDLVQIQLSSPELLVIPKE